MCGQSRTRTLLLANFASERGEYLLVVDKRHTQYPAVQQEEDRKSMFNPA